MNEINNNCVTFNVSDKLKEIINIYTDKDAFLNFVKNNSLNKNEVIEKITEDTERNNLRKLKRTKIENILKEYKTIEEYVTSIFSEAETINPASENNFKKIEEQKENDYQTEQVKNIDNILHGAEKAEFINFAKKKVMNALYIRSEHVPAKRKSFKYFITSNEDISNSLKMLQKEIYRELIGVPLLTVTTQKQVLTELYKKKDSFNKQQWYLYLLAINFDNFVGELSNNLITVENNSDIYAKKLKYTYKSKLDLIKNYGSSEVKIQENPGIKNYINTIATKDGIYLNTQSFNNAFHEIIKILGENNSLNNLYEDIDSYSNIMSKNINEYKWNTTLKNNVLAVFDNVFNKENENSLISIHLRTKEKYPKLSSDLYTMLCNSMNNMIPANYTVVTQDANTQNSYLNHLKEKNIDSHKTNIENHIVNSLNNESIENYLDKYIDISKVNGKLQATTKEGVISEGKLRFTFNKKVNITLISNNGSVKLLNAKSSNTEENNKAKYIIKNNNKFIQDTILINIKEIENAFDEISDDDGALNTLEFVGATILARIFNNTNKDVDNIETLKNLAKDQFGANLNYNHAFSEISNIFKPGIIALTGLEHLANVYAIVYGDANKSFVTNLENNKLPVYKNFSLGSTPNLLYDILKNEKISDGYKSTFEFNFLNNNIKWTSATMDSIMTINPKTKEEVPKSIINLNENELFYNSFVYNYLNSPTDIAFQTINYSDKSTILNQIFNRDELFKLIEDKVPEEYKNESFAKKITQVYYNHNKNIAQSLAHNILTDLNIILNKPSQETTYDNLLNTIEELISNFESTVDENGNFQSGISKLNNKISEILKINPKFKCIEEIHYSLDKKGNICINPTLLHFFEMFLTEDQNKFLEKINIQKALAVYDLKKSNFSIRHKTNKGKPIFKDVEGKEIKLLEKITEDTQEYILFENINPNIEFNVSNILLNNFSDIILDKKLEEFLLLDMFISDQFNLSAIGNAFIHNAKMKADETSKALSTEFKNKNVKYHRIASYESTQTISMYKRAVGYTANMFTPAKGLTMGLPDNLNFAILDDPQEIVINAQNTSGVVDSHDGAIFFSSLVNDMISTSLGELTVNKKFFKPFILLPHSNYCVTSEIKSAGFTINNYTIRESVNSSENYGVVFKKMHNIPFAENFVLNLNSNEFTGVSYLTDLGIENGEKYLATINRISTTDGRKIKVNRTISNKSNIKDSQAETIEYDINSIYDLWKMLGGAYSYKNDAFTEESLSKIYDLFEKNPDLKNYMVHFLVKPSACKTGITNRNGRESLLNSDVPFNSFSSPSHYFGMQLDASHEIEDGDVTGSVQQISSLIQGGFTEEEANDVYNGIGDLIFETMENLNLSSVGIDTPEKKEKLKETLSKFVINNASSRVDEAGLTNAIIRFAENQNNSIIPFDDPNIINLFTSLVNSVVTKNIIKRTSAGIPAIQSPTANLLSVIEDENGNILTNSEIYKNDLIVKDKIINNSNDLSLIKPGDVIILNNEYRLVAGYNNKIKKGFKHRYDIIGLEDVRNLDLSKLKSSLVIANSKGRNLRGQTHNITLTNGKKVDLFDLDISKLSYYLEDVKKNLKFSDDDIINKNLTQIYKEFKESLNNINNNLSTTLDNVMNNYISSKTDNSSLASINKVKYWNQLHELLNIVLQNELTAIKNGKFKLGNSYVDIKSTDIKSAECVLGNAYANKYGLKQNDFLGDILKNDNSFFKDKLTNAYYSNNTQNDLILMSLASSKIYVNIVEELNPKHVNNFKTITQDDGKQYIIDKNEKIIAPYNKDLIQIREENNQIILDIKLENLNLLNEPSIFGYIKINNTSVEVLNILKDNKVITDNFMVNEYLSDGIFDIDKYNDSLSNYIERQSKKLTTSFIQGLEYVGIRIPAQSMQSFMNLKVVAFTPEETNVVYIPSEIILYQGSDFDIDKLYMMGASINNQGIYDSWSPFFNYNSVNLLKLSHKLPIPTKKKIEQDINGLNIDNLIEGININSILNPLSEDKNSLIKFIKLLNQVNKVNSVTGSDSVKIEAFVNLINKHNLYDMTFDQKINAIKNKIYCYSLIIGNDVENYIFQTTPMSADVAKTIAQLAPNDIEHFSNNNFVSRLLAQYRTQVGKGGIGINANGIKGFSGLSIYFQNKYKNIKNTDDIKNLLFTIKDFDSKEKTLMNFDIPTIFNTNLNTVLNEDIRNSLNEEKWKLGNIPIDGFKLLSVLITAATDNAKDPILQGINCTPALNSMYILLISLGVDIYKVGEFFTSPFMLELSKHVNSDFSKEEQFENNLKSAINYMFDGPDINNFAPAAGWKYENNQFSFSNSIKVSNEEEIIDANDILDVEESEQFNKKSNINNKIWQSRYLAELKYYKDNIESKFEDILSKTKTENIKGRKVKSNIIKNNLLALENAAKELTSLVRLLSIDGGIKNNRQESLEYIHNIESNIKLKLGKESKFDLSMFLNNEGYNKTKVEEYEKNKSVFNVLDIINEIPHVKKMLQAMITAKNTINANTVKGKLGESFLKNIKYNFFPFKKLPSNTNNKIYKYLDQIITYKFLKENITNLTINNVDSYYTDDYLKETLINPIETKSLNFANYADVLTYKNWFEQKFIPTLKESDLYKYNKLISNLIVTSTFNSTRTERISLLSPNVDLSLLKLEGHRNKYIEFLNGFSQIKNSKHDLLDKNITIGDAFMLYNLIVNQNRPGKYSLNEIFDSYFYNDTDDSSIFKKFLKFETDLKNIPIEDKKDYDLTDLNIRFLQKDKEQQSLKKEWNKEQNKFIIKENGKIIKYIPNDDSLELSHFVKNIKYFKDDTYSKVYELLANAIKSNKAIIEFRCD